jgi:hypothetical protein
MKFYKLLIAFGMFAAVVVLALAANVSADSSQPGSGGRTDVASVSRATPTLGPTVAACPNKPLAPTLLVPTDGKQVRYGTVYLDWTKVSCAASYYVVVKTGGLFGTTVDEKGVYPSNYTTPILAAGRKYYWHVSACNWRGCTGSAWFSFTVGR